MQEWQKQQTDAGKQMQSMADNADQALRELSREHDRAMAQMSREHQTELDNGNRALVNSEVSLCTIKITYHPKSLHY